MNKLLLVTVLIASILALESLKGRDSLTIEPLEFSTNVWNRQIQNHEHIEDRQRDSKYAVRIYRNITATARLSDDYNPKDHFESYEVLKKGYINKADADLLCHQPCENYFATGRQTEEVSKMCNCTCDTIQSNNWGYYPWTNIMCQYDTTQNEWLENIVYTISGVELEAGSFLKEQIDNYVNRNEIGKCLTNAHADFLCEEICLEDSDTRAYSIQNHMCNCDDNVAVNFDFCPWSALKFNPDGVQQNPDNQYWLKGLYQHITQIEEIADEHTVDGSVLLNKAYITQEDADLLCVLPCQTYNSDAATSQKIARMCNCDSEIPFAVNWCDGAKCANKCSSDNCLSCDLEHICKQCETGYELIDNKCILIRTCEIEYCKDCAGTNCGVCEEGFKVSRCGDRCEPICDDQCKLCATNQTCTQCLGGYSVAANGSCVKCSVPNCANCSDDNICSVCQDGFELINNFCKPICQDDKCLVCSSGDNCILCEPGYKAYNGKCVLCQIEDCEVCQEANVCAACYQKDGQAFNLENNICEPICTIQI